MLFRSKQSIKFPSENTNPSIVFQGAESNVIDGAAWPVGAGIYFNKNTAEKKKDEIQIHRIMRQNDTKKYFSLGYLGMKFFDYSGEVLSLHRDTGITGFDQINFKKDVFGKQMSIRAKDGQIQFYNRGTEKIVFSVDHKGKIEVSQMGTTLHRNDDYDYDFTDSDNHLKHEVKPIENKIGRAHV